MGRIGYFVDTQFGVEIAPVVAAPLAGGGLEESGGALQREALTGDVTASAGDNSTTIAAGAVTNAKAADMAESTIKGRASGAGTGDPTDLTAQQARVVLRNAVMVRKAADQTTADYTAAPAVAWDQEVYDDGGWHDNSVANTRLTVPSGITRCRVGGNVFITDLAATDRVIAFLRKGGSSSFDGFTGNLFWHGSATSGSVSVASGPIPVTAGDYFELYLFITTDNSVTIVAAQSNFWAEAC